MRSAILGSFILAFFVIPSAAFSANNPGDYPLRVEILMNHWDRYRPFPVREPTNFLYRVAGQGNVMDGGTVHAFDFRYENDRIVRMTVRNQTYFARWKKPQHELEVLAPDIGHEGKYFTCVMQTTVREGVYLGMGQNITEVSQDDYQARRARAEATGASPAVQHAEAVTHVSVNSNPPGADIEVDGQLLGMTPSVLQLSLGDHTVALHKDGYKLWQRKMKVVPGEINLIADLDPETAN